MEVFEVHITGDKSILEHGEALGVKTIAVDLLRPDKSLLRSEYMTSIIMKCTNYETCKQQVCELSDKLLARGVGIIRTKIECPPYQHYLGSSLYAESHFKTTSYDDFPVSRNQKKDYLLATDRTYDKGEYSEFMKLHEDDELELCLFDSFIDEDLDWLSLWAKKERS